MGGAPGERTARLRRRPTDHPTSVHGAGAKGDVPRSRPRAPLESTPVRGQAELYAALAGEVDEELSWSEAELPEHQRTKHVHRLHPYLGKFVPQLVEVFLRRLFEPGSRVLDPFAGSGTTLVECSTF